MVSMFAFKETLSYRAYLDSSVLLSDEVKAILEGVIDTENMQEAMRSMHE